MSSSIRIPIGLGLVMGLSLAWLGCSPPMITKHVEHEAPDPHYGASVKPQSTGVAPEPSAVWSANAAPDLTAFQYDTELEAEMAQAIVPVSRKRGLKPKRRVRGATLSREQTQARVTAKLKQDVPPDVMRAQGELLKALDLLPQDYAFEQGIYDMLKGQLAGYYDPDVPAMFLLDDLSEGSRQETLAHELVHALQDQHFDLKAMLEYKQTDSDRRTAIHAVAEGDATLLTFQLGGRLLEPGAFRLVVKASVAMTAGSSVPDVLLDSLSVPYIDGYAFVLARFRAGGWAAVDAAYEERPVTTEQLLHQDKYLAREPAIAQKPVPSLGKDWRMLDDDSSGEQGLRITLEQWLGPTEAADAAAGWGGDRALMLEQEGVGTALGWRIEMDTTADAVELEKAFARRYATVCTQLTDGPRMFWARRGKVVAYVAADGVECEALERWHRRVVSNN